MKPSLENIVKAREFETLDKVRLRASRLKNWAKFFSKKLTVLLFLLYGSVGFCQTVLFVNHSASGSNTGANWANAFNSLQTAMEEENSHCETTDF